MKIPPLSEIEFSPLLWREFLQTNSEWKSIREFYPYLKEKGKDIDYCKEVQINASNVRVRRLINGYVMLDLLDWDNKIYLKYKFWQFFEDLTAEILRELLKSKRHCTVVHVDKCKKGLDYVIANNKIEEGWKVGVQCKRYIGLKLSKSKIKQVNSWSKGTSAVHLIEKGHELHERYGSNKKFVLICFNAFRVNSQQKNRFNELKKSWDKVIVLDKNTNGDIPYTYRIDASGLERIVDWC
jgi:hypothetical protein